MTKDISSPFTPGVPVPVEFFVGRQAEVEHLRGKVARAKQGQLQVAFVAGERGIGKSSLASFVRVLAEREYGMVSAHAYLGGVQSLEDMVRRVFDRLLKESLGKTWEKQVRDFFGEHIKKVGLFGISVEFDASSRELTRAAHDFAPALRNLCGALKGHKCGVVLVLDDINGLARSEQFANWLKSLVDEIATSQQPLPLCLILVGMEERRQELIECQPSLARVFDVVDIRAWTDSEARDFFAKAFASVEVEMEPEALALMAEYSGGLPVVAHEIGDAAFKADSDGRIDVEDGMDGVVDAAQTIGRKYLQAQVLDALRSEKYRTVLRKIAIYAAGDQFSRKQMRQHLSSEELKVLDSALRRMRDLGVIRGEGDRGVYSFTNSLHHVFFRVEAYEAGVRRLVVTEILPYDAE